MFDFKFDWDDAISIGIEEIDKQHQELFRIGRDIESLILTGGAGLTESQILQQLCDIREYVTYHFYCEEKIIETTNIAYLEDHKKKHDEFKEIINAINCEQLVKEPLKGFKEVKVLLQDWLFQHILVEDRKIKVEKVF